MLSVDSGFSFSLQIGPILGTSRLRKSMFINTLRFRYQTLEVAGLDIHVRTLKDNQQFEDPHGEAEQLGISSALWPIFGIVWDSGLVLAHYMSSFDIVGKRILEIGCGVGVASLVINQRRGQITSSDYHPRAEEFLDENVRINLGKSIPFYLVDWSKDNSELGKFDVIIGSDLLYEPGNDVFLSDFLERHTMPNAEVIIVDPGRRIFNRFTKCMTRLSFEHSRKKVLDDVLDKPYKGFVNHYIRSSDG